MAKIITDMNELREMFHHFETIHIAFNDGDYPYIVPMNYGIEEENEDIVLYIYSPRIGRLDELMHKDPHVGLQAEMLYKYYCVPHKTISCSYLSIMGTGIIESIPQDQYQNAMESILVHCGYETYPYDKDYVNGCHMYKITVNHVTGKMHLKGE